jgi:hypothetical protein
VKLKYAGTLDGEPSQKMPGQFVGLPPENPELICMVPWSVPKPNVNVQLPELFLSDHV